MQVEDKMSWRETRPAPPFGLSGGEADMPVLSRVRRRANYQRCRRSGLAEAGHALNIART